MSLMQEHLLERLWSRYEKRFGTEPPFDVATVDEALARLQDALRDCAPPEGRPPLHA